MQNDQKPPLPIGLLALETLGMVLVGIGIAKAYGGVDLLPPSAMVEGYEIALIVIGLVLTIPWGLHIARMSKARKEGRPS